MVAFSRQSAALDRFGRVIDQIWADDSQNVLDEYRYGYDAAGNRDWKQNVTAAALDELYSYDVFDSWIGETVSVSLVP